MVRSCCGTARADSLHCRCSRNPRARTLRALRLLAEITLPAPEKATCLGNQPHQLFHTAFAEEREIGSETQADAPALQRGVGLAQEWPRIACLCRGHDGGVKVECGLFHAPAEDGAARARHPLALNERLPEEVIGAGEERRFVHGNFERPALRAGTLFVLTPAASSTPALYQQESEDRIQDFKIDRKSVV